MINTSTIETPHDQSELLETQAEQKTEQLALQRMSATWIMADLGHENNRKLAELLSSKHGGIR